MKNKDETFQDYLKEKLKDPEFREQYELEMCCRKGEESIDEFKKYIRETSGRKKN